MLDNLLISLKIIVIFKNIVEDNVVSSFIEVLKLYNDCNSEKFLSAYSKFIYLLYEKDEHQNLYNYVKNLIYTDENILSNNLSSYNQQILDTAKYELSLIDKLLMLNFDDFKLKIKNRLKNKQLIEHLPIYNNEGRCDIIIEDILKSYKENGYGKYACYSAFVFNSNKEIIPVKYFETMTFSQLKKYEYQKKVIYDNTKAFLDGKDANNILLYGDRGCGKSSTVKALINEFKQYNLKIIQISKDNFVYLSDLYEQIRKLPVKFIIFADDISFNEDDRSFSSIKAALEGALETKPKNAIIYATTNRIHLVKENFSSRDGNEIHCNDTIDEIVSLSDRFGIMLTFSLLTKNEYLDIVKKIALDNNIKVDDKFLQLSEQFAIQKSIRTPRTAKQFIVDFIAKQNT